MITLTPETSTELEYVPFSISYTIASDDPYITPEIVNVTVWDGAIDITYQMLITMTSSTSFNLSGTFSDMFNRTMTYLDANDVTGMVSKFSDIPEDFNTLYKYVGAQVNAKTLTVNVDTTEGTVSSTININNNYTTANAKLKEYVAKGKF